MSTFKEANQVRLSLKMKLAAYAWYHSSIVTNDPDGFGVVVYVKQLDNKVRKLIPPVVDGISIKTEVQ